MAPIVGFHGQPFDEDETAGAILQSLLQDSNITELTIAVAWARYRGLVRLRAEIDAFRARGGTLRVILGIDEGGATRPGLLGIADIADEAFVFHDPGGGTFHPKVYLAEGAMDAVLFVGSSNLTPGGLYVNVEASLEARFTLPDEAKDPALVAAREFVARLRGDGDACRPLTPELVDQMVNDDKYRIAGNERRKPRSASPAPGADPEDIEEVGSTAESDADAQLFRRSRQTRARVPALSAQDRADLAARELDDESSTDGADQTSAVARASVGGTESTGSTAASGSGSTGRAGVTVTDSWSKPLSNSDAQRTSGSTNPTGVLRLAQARNPIDHRTWFRRQLFRSPVQWAPETDGEGNPIEVARVDFDLEIDGVRRGNVTLKLDHAPHREAGQNNVPSILHWGELAAEMRSTDHGGKELVIERLSNGTFRLRIG